MCGWAGQCHRAPSQQLRCSTAALQDFWPHSDFDAERRVVPVLSSLLFIPSYVAKVGLLSQATMVEYSGVMLYSTVPVLYVPHQYR